MSQLWQIIQKHLDETGVREAEFARRIGTSPTTVNSWKNRGVRNLPDRRLLQSVAEVTGVRYNDVLRAVLVDIGYLQAGQELSGGRRHHGAWELGPEILVRMVLAAQDADVAAQHAAQYTEEDDFDEVISEAENTATAVDELVSIVRDVAELGVGGRAALLLAIDKERTRQREIQRERREKARKVAAEIRAAGTEKLGGAQSDHALAARTGAGKTREQVEYERHAAAGEESHPDGPEGGA